MRKVHWILVIACAFYCCVEGKRDGPLCFPSGFVFGVATASFQVEGAWNVSGKGENIWDRYTHTYPDRVADHRNADIATDSYNLYKEDVKMLSALSVDFYRFSVSWSRILPGGSSNIVNKDGIRYYNDLIDELVRNNIQPVLTMYHWDLPQVLQDLGGWTNPIMADYFVDYARVLFQSFGDKVTIWLTFNEPWSFCEDGYGGNAAPGARASGFEDYMCAHTVLRAHGMVYRMYENEFKNKQKGYVGITLDFSWLEPASTSEEDQLAAETARQFMFGWFANPILSKTGDYPAIMRNRVDYISKKQGYSRSRLPHFTRQEVETIRGSFDFLGLNHYTTQLVINRTPNVKSQPSYWEDIGVTLYQKKEWPSTNSSWLKVVPWGFRKTLNYVKNTYNNPPILITENGVSMEAATHDPKRVNYIEGYLKAVQAAVVKDNCRVIGYTYWSLMDNYEWMSGFTQRFGLYHVDFTSPVRKRTARLSASYYSHIVKTRCIPEDYVPYIFDD